MSQPRRAGIILCGGASQRMGEPKAWLRFGSETLLERSVRLLANITDETIVVAAHEQTLPALPKHVRVVYDNRPGCGPLEGLSAGLNALPTDCSTAYVTACDAPFLRAAFVERMFSLLAGYDCAVPRIDERFQPLAAVYRATVRTTIDTLLAAGSRRVWSLFDHVNARLVSAAELRDVDPQLDSLRGCNTPDEYQALLAKFAADET